MAWLEGGNSLTDAAAIVYAIKRRVGGDTGERFVAMSYAYSQLDANHERAAFARQLPNGPEPTWSRKQNERWAFVRATARAALEGRAPNPCPRSIGWGGTMDEPRAGQLPMRCRIRTHNWFYRRAPAWRVLLASEAAPTGVTR